MVNSRAAEPEPEPSEPDIFPKPEPEPTSIGQAPAPDSRHENLETRTVITIPDSCMSSELCSCLKREKCLNSFRQSLDLS